MPARPAATSLKAVGNKLLANVAAATPDILTPYLSSKLDLGKSYVIEIKRPDRDLGIELGVWASAENRLACWKMYAPTEIVLKACPPAATVQLRSEQGADDLSFDNVAEEHMLIFVRRVLKEYSE